MRQRLDNKAEPYSCNKLFPTTVLCVHTHTHTHTHTYIYMCVYIYLFIYVCVFLWFWLESLFFVQVIFLGFSLFIAIFLAAFVLYF